MLAQASNEWRQERRRFQDPLSEPAKVGRQCAVTSRLQGHDLRPHISTVGDPGVQQENGAETLAGTPLLTHSTT